MLIGRAILGFKNNSFNTTNCVNNFYKIEIQNAIFDEIKIDENIDMIYNSNKEEWGYDTIFDYKANNNNLEAGNVDNKGIPIEKILFQKRNKDEELEWTNVAVFDFNAIQRIYSYIDRYVENNIQCEYAVVPLTQSISGQRTIIEFIPKFEGVFLTDKENNYKLSLNLERGDMEYNNPSCIHESLGSEFPITRYSSLNYRKQSIKASVISNLDNLQQNNATPHEEKLYRDKLMSFLKNHKPKIFRDSNGNFMMVNIVNNPKFSYENKLNGIIGSVSFDMVEKNTINGKTLKNNGFIDV